MDEQFHIIVTGDKGKIRRFPFSKRKISLLAGITSFILLIFLTATISSLVLLTKNRALHDNLTDLEAKIFNTAKLIETYEETIERQKLQFELKNAKLELNSLKRANSLRQENNALISNAVNELNERSELIENMVNSITDETEVKVIANSHPKIKNSGGIFIASQDTVDEDLLSKADKYLDKIRILPFGRPLKKIKITSGFGTRRDPKNGKSAFHTGIDFKGKRGDKVFATANGIVTKAFYNSGYGNYVQIDHGNGYKTSFSHLKKFLVKKGENVQRGQLIGLVGNSGRSTGPHLHYEISRNNKPINPSTFLKVATRLSNQESSLEN